MADKITTILGKVSLTPRGLYDATANYEKLDVITHNGSSFLALEAFQGVEPMGDDKTTMLLSAKGKDLKLSDLTPEEEDRLKLHFSDLTENEIALLQEPAKAAVSAANRAASDAAAAALVANASTGKANEATQKALDAAAAAEGIVSDIRPDYNVDDKTLPTFIANRPELPVLLEKPSSTLLTYTNSYGNLIRFRDGDEAVFVDADGNRIYYKAREVAKTSINWVEDESSKYLHITNQKEIEANKTYAFYPEKNKSLSGNLVETADHADLLESLYAYGVEIDTAVEKSTHTRVGNMDLHKSLPIQNKMRRCLVKPKKEPYGKYPNFVLNPNDVGSFVVENNTYTITQKHWLMPVLIIDNIEVGKTYKFRVETEETGMQLLLVSQHFGSFHESQKTIALIPSGGVDIEFVGTYEMADKRNVVGIVATNKTTTLKPISIFDVKEFDYKRYNIISNPVATIGTQSIISTTTGYDLTFQQYHGTTPQLVFDGLVVGDVVEFKMKYNFVAGTEWYLMAAKKYSTTADQIIIKKFTSPRNDGFEHVRFTVTADMLSGDRRIGFVCGGNNPTTVGNKINIYYSYVKSKLEIVNYYLNENDSEFKETLIPISISRSKNIDNYPYQWVRYYHVDRVSTIFQFAGEFNAIFTLTKPSVGEHIKFKMDYNLRQGGVPFYFASTAGPGHSTAGNLIVIAELTGKTSINIDFVVTEEMVADGREIGIVPGAGNGNWQDNTATIYYEDYYPAKLDGTDGDVMVELPEYYIKFSEKDAIQRCMISEHKIPGYTYMPKAYIGAFHGVRLTKSLHPTPAAVSDGLWSVINKNPWFRGGSCAVVDGVPIHAAWDETAKSQLGKPYCGLSANDVQTNTYNRNLEHVGINGYSPMTYNTLVTLQWLCTIEYARYDYDAEFNAELTPEGYKQGGIGSGVINGVYAALKTFFGDGQNVWGIVPIGLTASLGNKTGEVTYTPPVAAIFTDGVTHPNSYRGVENMCSNGHTLMISEVNAKITGDSRYQTQRDVFSEVKSILCAPMSGWIWKVNFKDQLGVLPEILHGSQKPGFTRAASMFDRWSVDYTPSKLRVGTTILNKDHRTLLSQVARKNYDNALDTTAYGRLNYTIPR